MGRNSSTTRRIKKELMEMLSEKKACSIGTLDVILSKSESEIAGLFWEYYRFSVAKSLPSPEYIANRIPQATEQGIYANAKDVNLHNERQVALLGASVAKLSYDGGGCAHVIITDNSRAEITIKEGFALWLDVQRNGRVSIVASDYSTLRVHRYGRNTYVDIVCDDNADYKVIKHEEETYDRV